jgi:hypothetical protein
MELWFCLLFCMGLKLDRSHWGTDVDWGCLRIGCWGEYLDLRGTKQQVSGENYRKRRLMISTPHPVFFGWLNREEWDGRVCSAYVREERRIRVLVGKPEGTRALGRPRHRWEDNIKMDLKEVGSSWLRIGTGVGDLCCEGTVGEQSLNLGRWLWLVGGWRPRPGRFTSLKEPRYYCIEGWSVGCGVVCEGKGKPRSVQPVACHYTDCTTYARAHAHTHREAT